MIELKPLKPEAVSAALDKARRYRLLNEPDEAESICHDILESTPDHQEALITLLLSLTDKEAVRRVVCEFSYAVFHRARSPYQPRNEKGIESTQFC